MPVNLSLHRELVRLRRAAPDCDVRIDGDELAVFAPVGAGGLTCRVTRASDALRAIELGRASAAAAAAAAAAVDEEEDEEEGGFWEGGDQFDDLEYGQYGFVVDERDE